MNAPEFAIDLVARLRARADALDPESMDAVLYREAADFMEAERNRINALRRLTQKAS